MVKYICQMSEACRTLLKTAMKQLGLWARAYDRILRMASTEEIQLQHLTLAIQYCRLGRGGWAS